MRSFFLVFFVRVCYQLALLLPSNFDGAKKPSKVLFLNQNHYQTAATVFNSRKVFSVAKSS